MDIESTDRINWIDSVKAFSIIAVIIFHANIIPEIKNLCLPGFLFVSGLFALTDVSFTTFIKRRTARILIPYIIFGLLSWIAWLLIGRKYGADMDDLNAWWKPLFGMICGQTDWFMHNFPLWFLCCLVSTELIYYLISHITIQSIRWLICIMIAGVGCALGHYGYIGLWAIVPAMIVLPIYMIAAENKEYILSKAISYNYLTLALGLILSIVGITIGYIFNPSYDIALSKIGNAAIFYITAFSVVIFWSVLSLLIEKSIGQIKWFQYLGMNTMIILCIHIPLFGAIKGIGMFCNVPLAFWGTTTGGVTLIVTTIILLFPIIYCINRYLPLITGKRRMLTP